MSIPGRQIAQAIIQTVITASGRSCGYSTVPTSLSQPTGNQLPYHVLYELGQTVSGPPFGDAAGDARLLVQVTTVGNSPEAASSGADRVRTGLLGRSPDGSDWLFSIVAPAGYAVVGRELDREDGMSVAGSTYSYVQRFAVHVTTTG
ncbi:hypothetical protein SRB5_15760 [Streptomyces sp. RB5]|uniref:DUF3168 domain-containing protein n=1 Tax=Streptomyces smaragdinus TaxID=2585196 RepID=A0A7K0CDB8_9ACTN|nr:hypothetical protein [Streptomyces smaragdinus]MQY11458.1 hypothetical protein [Streptomyces smaragdinus]